MISSASLLANGDGGTDDACGRCTWLGVTPPWKLIGQRLDTDQRPNELHIEVAAWVMEPFIRLEPR